VDDRPSRLIKASKILKIRGELLHSSKAGCSDGPKQIPNLYENFFRSRDTGIQLSSICAKVRREYIIVRISEIG